MIVGDRSIRIWNIHTGDCLRELTGHGRGIGIFLNFITSMPAIFRQ